MHRSLSDLRDSVNRLIQEQGENAPCSAFIFTKNDVTYFGKDENGDIDLDRELSLNEEDTDKVLKELGDSDYIYEQIFEVIEDEIRRILKHKNM